LSFVFFVAAARQNPAGYRQRATAAAFFLLLMAFSELKHTGDSWIYFSVAILIGLRVTGMAMKFTALVSRQTHTPAAETHFCRLRATPAALQRRCCVGT
jgi:hypothetical protein